MEVVWWVRVIVYSASLYSRNDPFVECVDHKRALRHGLNSLLRTFLPRTTLILFPTQGFVFGGYLSQLVEILEEAKHCEHVILR